MLGLKSRLNSIYLRHIDPSRNIYSQLLPAESRIVSSRSEGCSFYPVTDLEVAFNHDYRSNPNIFGDPFHILELVSKARFEHPAQGIIKCKNFYIYGKNGWLINGDGFLLSDPTWYRQYEAELPTRLNRRLSLHKLKGTVISLCSDHSSNNYGHFLLDCLTRIRLLQGASISLDDADHIIIPKPPGPNAISLCEKAGIPLAKCIWSDKDTLFYSNHLIATTFPGLRRSYPKWAASYLNGLNDFSRQLPFRKIYIPRKSLTRNIINDASLQKIALHYGYEIYDPALASDQSSYEMFAQATHVVSAHGAALTDLAFCTAGAKILELIPSDHIYPYYYTLSLASNLVYHCIFGESTNVRPTGSVGPSPYDFVVDCDLFSEALRYLG
jgi:hypothetical protein